MVSLRLRLFISLLVFVAGLAFTLPNIPGVSNSFLASVLPQSRINLGLDLKGGMSLTLGVDVEKAIENTLSSMGQRIREYAAQEKLTIVRPKLNSQGELEIIVPKADDVDKVFALIEEYYPTLVRTGVDSDSSSVSSVSSASSATTLRYVLSDAARAETEAMTLDQVVRTIRNRIDQFGVAEPDIRRQSGNQVQIQLPGLTDAERAIQLVGQTAHLAFHLVRDDIDPNAMILPMGTSRFEMLDDGGEKTLVLDTTSLMTGSDIANARPAFDQYGTPYVSLTFSPKGSMQFETITGENIKRRLAIVLDGKVYSAPVIQDKIAGGSASISGDFTTEEANDLAVILRAGSLPAPVSILEERSVGPSLGQESINSGMLAAFIGALVVFVIMPLFYGMAGVIADGLLCFTMLLLFAGLTAFGATLTLPGIAGVVLTIGMAVDANVLIFERIREELKKGKMAVDAVKIGFKQASVSILDSNLTTIIAAVILYQFGTGPIRGFAITLSLGILASMFTSIFVCRTIFEYWMQKNGGKHISV